MDEPIRDRRRPTRSLWEGIYIFPWDPDNLGVLLGLAAAFTFLALVACGFRALFVVLATIPEEAELSGGALLIYRGSAHVFGSLCIFALVGSLYPAACLLRVIEDTAAGSDQADWSQGSWLESIGKLLFLIWILACCAVVAVGLVASVRLLLPLPAAVGSVLVFSLVVAVLPVFLLSTLTAGSPWMVIEPRLLASGLRSPGVVAVLYVHSVLIWLPSALLGYWMVWELQWWLTPLAGLVGAMYLLIYGRVLGRVGWRLAQGETKKGRRKRRKRRTEEDDSD